MFPQVRPPFIHHISVQDVYTPFLVNCLCLLVHQALALGYVKDNDPIAVICHGAPFPPYVDGKLGRIPQVGNHFTPAVSPCVSTGVAIRITNVMVVFGPVWSRLLLVFGIERIVPPRIIHKASIYPSDVEDPVTGGHPVDVWIALNPCQVGADVLVATVFAIIGVKMVVAESSLAVTVGEEHVLAEEAESGVCHVAEGLVGGWDSREVVKSDREDVWTPTDGTGLSGYVPP